MNEEQIPKPKSDCQLAIERVLLEIKSKKEILKCLRDNQAKIEKAGLKPALCGQFLDFDFLKHKDVVKVIRTFPGRKWKKIPNGEGRVDYSSESGGVSIRCYQGEPPPNCRIVEEEIHYPEQIVPARVERVKKLVCKPGILTSA